jgi:hypothetical protein
MADSVWFFFQVEALQEFQGGAIKNSCGNRFSWKGDRYRAC